MATIFTDAVVKPVYFERGTLTQDARKKRYLRAPFNMVVIKGQPYIMPAHIDRATDKALGQVADADSEIADMWRGDLGYETLEPVVIGEHQMGDGTDCWYGLQRFSTI